MHRQFKEWKGKYRNVTHTDLTWINPSWIIPLFIMNCAISPSSSASHMLALPCCWGIMRWLIIRPSSVWKRETQLKRFLRQIESPYRSLLFYGKMNRFYGVLCFTEKWIASMQFVFYGEMNRFYAVLSFTEKWIASVQSCVLRRNESLLCSLVFYRKMNFPIAVSV